MNKKLRDGFFTSSNAVELIPFESRVMTPDELADHKKEFPKSRKKNCAVDGFGATGKTYIQEVFIERISGRSIDTDVKTIPMKWGSLMEIVLFNRVGLDWTMTHKQTIKHHKYGEFWSGTPDFIATKAVAECKCFQPKNYMKLVLCLMRCIAEGSPQHFKETYPKEYWQCVSNAILTKKKRALIVGFMPYKSDLIALIDQIRDTDYLVENGLDLSDYYFMDRDKLDTLPYLPDESEISDINMYEFEVPKEDIELLTSRMIDANNVLEFKLEEFEELKKAVA